MLSQGTVPRVRLRYRYRPGETLRYRLSTRRVISGLPAAAPVVVRLSVLTAKVQGRLARLRWQVEGVGDRVEGVGRTLRGVSLWLETSDRGEISRVSQGRAEQRSGAQLKHSVQQLYLAWPEAKVGVGARWEQRRRVILVPRARGGFKAQVLARYSFDRLADCGRSRCAYLTVRTELRLDHRAGAVQVGGRGQGSGRVVFDLGTGRLLESRTTAEMSLFTSLHGGVAQRLQLDQSLQLTR